MKIERGTKSRAELITRWTARGLTLLVMGFWLWFAVASLIVESAQHGWGGPPIHLVQMAVFIVLIVLAFYFELAAGLAFIVLAGLAYFQWGRHTPAVALTMCLPMLIIGVLYVVAWVLGRRRMREQR